MTTRSTQTVKAIAATLKARCGITPGAHILVAVSGGPDSVALLRALHLLAPRRGWNLKLTVAHVHHHLRPSADTDAQFTADLAAQLNLSYLCRDIHPAGSSGNLEAAARRERYRALADAARQAAAHWVATAHHADDQLETLVMRLLRGASLRGLSAIPWTRPLTEEPPITLIRPMLDIARTQIVDCLTELNQSHCNDPTNADTSLLRNRIRHDLLPGLYQIDANAPHRATQLADLARQHQQLLDHAVQDALQHVSHHDGTTHLDRHVAANLPADGLVLSALLRHLLTDAGVPADTLASRTLSQMTTAIRDQTGGHRRFTLANNIRLELTRDSVTIVTGIDACETVTAIQEPSSMVRSPSAPSPA